MCGMVSLTRNADPLMRVFLLVAMALVALSSVGHATDVELFTDSAYLEPSSTLEFRFSEPIIDKNSVGPVSGESPVIIQPALPGKFTWLSTRSGVFVPDSAPPLGTEFRVSIRPGLRNLAGKEVGKGFQATVKTPPFAVYKSKLAPPETEDLSPNTEQQLAFNLAVNAEEAARFLRFVNSDGKSVGAIVRYATGRDYFLLPPTEGDWEKRWRLAKNPSAAPLEEESEADLQPSKEPLTDRLVITPAEPLTPGGKWSLEVKKGLPANSTLGKYQIAETLLVPLGSVEPFKITKLTTSSYVNSGRIVTVEFSDNPAPDISSEDVPKFIALDPPVPNLKVEDSYQAWIIRGDFERGKDYTLTVNPSLISQQGLPLEGSTSRRFFFNPISPRLYLPEITGHQIRGGQRKFEIQSVNLKALNVKAIQVDVSQIPRAIAAFAKYNKDYDPNQPDESYQALPKDPIEGKVLAEKTLELGGEVDSAQQTALDWNEIVGANATGAIFLTLEGEPVFQSGTKKPGAQALVQLTDIGVLWKKLENDLRVTIFSLATGKPMPGAEMDLQDAQFNGIGGQVTDSEGVAMISIAAGAAPAWLSVRVGDDALAMKMGPGAEELPVAGFRLPVFYNAWEGNFSPPRARSLLFTDRPLYRPGELVRVKGIVRAIDDSGAIRTGKFGDAKLTLTNPRGDKIGETTAPVADNGAFDASIALPSTGTGAYSLRAEISGDTPVSTNTAFQVADFQPNAFEVTTGIPGRIQAGTAITGRVSAKYLFGAPLTRADVRWTLQQVADSFSPTEFPDFKFPASYDLSDTQQRPITLYGQARIDDKTPNPEVAPRLPDVRGFPVRGVLTVEVTDINQQTVSQATEFTRDASSFYLGVAQPERFVFHVGDEIPMRVIAVAPDGQPLAQPVEIKAELVYLRNNTVRVQGAGKAISFRTETIEEPIAAASGKTLIPAKEGQNWKVRDGETVRFKPKKTGGYRMLFTATDDAGRPAVTEWRFYVSGSDEVAWDYRNAAQVDLVPDKSEYHAGETARILVKTPISGEALVTIERGKRLLRTQKLLLSGNAPVIEVPIEATDAPNVFVSMLLIRGANDSPQKYKMPEYRQGICMLSVADPAARLEVTVNPAMSDYQPGEQVETEVVVRDGLGKPMPDAEVTFYAVDDGILALTGYDRPKPFEVFWQPFSLAVRTGLSFLTLLPEDPQDLEFSNKGYLIGGGGLEGPGAKLRTNFPGTLAWLPKLRTDAGGKVVAKFVAPDAITRYRLVAVAHALGKFFGSGEAAFNIRKPLMLLPSIGQFAHNGDSIEARAVVRNDTGGDGEAEVTLLLDPLTESPKPTTTKIALRNGESRAVDFQVRFRETGTATWKWSTKLEHGSRIFEDAVQSTFPITSPSLLLRETDVVDLNAKRTDLLANVNPQILEGAGSVAVTVANTRLASLRESVDRLLHYPYGCAEQTISTLIPWVVLPELIPVIADADAAKLANPKTVSEGVSKIFALQTPSGGISYWPGNSQPSLFASAYAALFLSAVVDRQLPVPEDAHRKLLAYLSTALRGTAKVRDETALGERCLALYALAASGKAEGAYHQELFERRAELSRESRALLALAILADTKDARMVRPLLDPKAEAPDNFSPFGGAARERAIQLMAWSRFDPKSKEVGRLVKELLGYRHSGHFGSTQENAFALLALARYYKAVEAPAGAKNVEGMVILNDQTLPFSVTRKQPSQTEVLEFTPSKPLATLAVENPKQGALFGEARYVVAPLLGQQPRQDRGFAVSRSYQKLADDGSLTAAGNLKVGDRVLVTLRVSAPRPGHFVAIDDPLPAIFEAVNPSFKSKAVGGDPSTTADWTSDYREIRADRVLIFCDTLPAGAFSFQYLARVRTAGDVIAPATKVEEMYRPERFGLSETMKVASAAE